MRRKRSGRNGWPRTGTNGEAADVIMHLADAGDIAHRAMDVAGAGGVHRRIVGKKTTWSDPFVEGPDA
jgi:hypothetical protein